MPRFTALGEADDAQIFIGEDVTIRVQLVKKDSNGVDVVEGDISGNAYTFSLKEDEDDADTIMTDASPSFANGDTTVFPPEITGTNSVAVFAIADTDTDELPPGTYQWDVKRTDTGNEAVVAFGTIVLRKGIGA